jgi:nucleoside 2-deoxyribosyltransferase
MKVYLAARFRNKGLLRDVRELWRARGYDITSRWLDGDPQDPTDNAVMDTVDVERADVLVLYLDSVQAGERPMAGAWFEFGYAVALRKKIVVVNRVQPDKEPYTCLFLNLPGITTVTTWKEADDWIFMHSKEVS